MKFSVISEVILSEKVKICAVGGGNVFRVIKKFKNWHCSNQACLNRNSFQITNIWTRK